MEQIPLTLGDDGILQQSSTALNSLFDSCDDILEIWEYRHDKILPSFIETLEKASDLALIGQLSQSEKADCLASCLFLRDAICSLLEIRLRLADRVNQHCRPWTKWKKYEINA